MIRRKRKRVPRLKINGAWEHDCDVLKSHVRMFYVSLFYSNNVQPLTAAYDSFRPRIQEF
ncbi:hypothetical protein COLO4_02643 [Corchorus olitorius]|uniref:Uncharacterized protein n=1 Tax=Corchorus olitorius TaxID=93759 RepID=A0A1R3L0S8_9ROSI|nr:hypothetical protein COLO4_02643 [Corchorus olitorius]